MNRKLKSVLLLIFAVAIIAVFYRIIGCPFLYFLGVPCPGCGTTRAWFLFINGRFEDAFRMYPLFLITPPFVLAAILVRGQFFRSKVCNTAFIAGFALLVIGVYAVRMYHMFPDIEPMVYNGDAIVNKILSYLEEVET